MPEKSDGSHEFESEEELNAFVDRLADQSEFLEDELADSEQDTQELKNELKAVRDSSSELKKGEIEAINAILDDLEEWFSEAEAHLEDRGNLSGEVVDTISDITGEDHTHD